jgi:hypothetical protein
MSSPLPPLIDALARAVHEVDWDEFARLHDELRERARGCDTDELTEAVELMAPILAKQLYGWFSALAVLTGAFVEWGGSPRALAADTPAWAVQAMKRRVWFSGAWRRFGNGQPEPDIREPDRLNDLTGMFQQIAADNGLDELACRLVACSWYDAPKWINLLITALGHREFRDACPLRAEIADYGRQLTDVVPRAHWLPGLALVLDDEPVVAIDQVTGNGYRLTMSGVGDNYQLHTLLADRLIGDPGQGLLAGERPEAAWVAAATDGPPIPFDYDQLVHRRFVLFDGTGAYIRPEGKPNDIAVVDGVRLIALHPTTSKRSWDGGRVYQGMVPTFTLDIILSPAESAAWQARIAPAQDVNTLA